MLLAVEQVIAGRLGVDADRIVAPTRGPVCVVFARHLALYLAHTAGGLSLTQSGQAFERTRGAAMHAINRLDARREIDPAFDHALTLMQADVTRRYAHHLTRWHAGV